MTHPPETPAQLCMEMICTLRWHYHAGTLTPRDESAFEWMVAGWEKRLRKCGNGEDAARAVDIAGAVDVLKECDKLVDALASMPDMGIDQFYKCHCNVDRVQIQAAIALLGGASANSGQLGQVGSAEGKGSVDCSRIDTGVDAPSR
jgi:hypothetical protein